MGAPGVGGAGGACGEELSLLRIAPKFEAGGMAGSDSVFEQRIAELIAGIIELERELASLKMAYATRGIRFEELRSELTQRQQELAVLRRVKEGR